MARLVSRQEIQPSADQQRRASDIGAFLIDPFTWPAALMLILGLHLIPAHHTPSFSAAGFSI
jgi:hypothetical protein